MLAEVKFWNTPELAEKLLSLLDPASVVGLVQSKVLEKQILQKSLSLTAWNRLIRRCSSNGGGPHCEGLLEKEHVKDAVKILRLINLEDPSMYLLPLLDVVCQFLPGKSVEMVCPRHENPHSISSYAFLLLEEVESSFGTLEQSIKSISAAYLYGPLLSAVVSRMSRQQGKVVSVRVHTIFIKNKSDAHAFTTLLQAQTVSARTLQVTGQIGEDGWQVLARALQIKPNVVVEAWVSASRQGFAEARKEDIKAIWDNQGIEGGFVFFSAKAGKDHFLAILPANYEYDWAHAWTRLKQILDMTEEEFNAEIEEVVRRMRDGDEEEEHEEGDAGGEEDGEDDDLGGEEGGEEES